MTAPPIPPTPAGMAPDDPSRPVVVERVTTSRGELVLRRVAATGRHEIISNGLFLMDTRDGTSERLLVTAALDAAPHPARVLIGGLGVGFSLVAALAHGAVRHVTVVEVEAAIIAWHGTHLAGVTAGALDDPRVTVVCADLVTWLADDGPGDRDRRDQGGPGEGRPGAGGAHDDGSGAGGAYDVICVDIDNGPDWTVTGDNAALYGDGGLAALRHRLADGGALAVWSAAAAPVFERRLRRWFGDVRLHTVAVVRGAPDHVYVARGPRDGA